jgi:hypothetical protein
MTEDDAQAAFDRWVAEFKRDLPGGNTVSVFLSTDPLAGLRPNPTRRAVCG